MRSAYDAGCRVAFVPDLTDADDEIRSKAEVFRSLDELRERLSREMGGDRSARFRNPGHCNPDVHWG